jgi:hypothetical protein
MKKLRLPLVLFWFGNAFAANAAEAPPLNPHLAFCCSKNDL